MTQMTTSGSCLCGAVRFTGHGAIRAVTPCHCGQCRQWSSGPFWAVHFTDGLTLGRAETLAWYDSSENASRGFCTRCGSALFWRVGDAGRDWATSAGALDDQSGLSVTAHVWVEDAPGWYALPSDVPCYTKADFYAARTRGEV